VSACNLNGAEINVNSEHSMTTYDMFGIHPNYKRYPTVSRNYIFLRDTDGARGALYGKKFATSMNYGVCTGHHLGENCHSSNFAIALFTQVSWHSCVYSGKSSTYTEYIPYTAGNYTPYICVASCYRYVQCLLTTWRCKVVFNIIYKYNI
jgi:hypothetical protein